MTSLKENLGRRIQAIRKSKKLTQEKLAEIINLDTPNLSNIERGKRFVSSETLEKIIKALNIEASDLFDFEHLKTKEELITLINDILINSTDNDVQYYYRMLVLHQEYK
jgi:transcriptional regulator with XRE-family HTH domain